MSSNPSTAKRVPAGLSLLYLLRTTGDRWYRSSRYKRIDLLLNFLVGPIVRKFSLKPAIFTLNSTGIMKQVIASAALFAASTNAIAPWGQCGGKGWTGSGTCDSGSTCVYSNDCE